MILQVILLQTWRHLQGIALCKPSLVADQVHLDEVSSLQPEVHELLCESFPNYRIISSQPADGNPDERIQFEGADIGGLVLKTDSDGNTYARCARHFVGSALVQREAAKRAHLSSLLSSCRPMLWCEISCPSLRICAAGFVAGEFAFEPLTPALHLFGINNPEHMLTLARCCSAFRQTLAHLAMSLQSQLSQDLHPPDTSAPYYIREQFSGADVRQLLPGGRLAFLVRRPEPDAPVIVKLIAQAADGNATAVHCLWANAGLAPQQVWLHNEPHTSQNKYLLCSRST